jgi:putative acetyltransferase
VGDLVNPSITFVSARNGCQLLAVGALREIDDEHGEIKSMHTSHAARGQGIGASVLTYLVDIARERAYRRVSLETGSDSMFVPARSLYAKAGFVLCEPFGDYRESPTSTYMTLELAGVQCGPRPRSTPVSGGG